MFTTGRWIFTIIFLILFTTILFRSYQKDKKLHQKNFKGVIWVFVGFVVLIILLLTIKYLLKN